MKVAADSAAPATEIIERIIPIISLWDRKSTCWGRQTVRSELDQNLSGHLMQSVDPRGRREVEGTIIHHKVRWKSRERRDIVKAVLCGLSLCSTCFITDFPPWTVHTVKTALRSAFLHSLSCPSRTRCAAYRHRYLHFEKGQSLIILHHVHLPSDVCMS